MTTEHEIQTPKNLDEFLAGMRKIELCNEVERFRNIMKELHKEPLKK